MTTTAKQVGGSLVVNGRDFNCIAIPTSSGKYALIDVEDFPRVSGYRWTALANKTTHYVRTRINGKWAYMHRLLMNLTAQEVDHRNGNGLDNRRSCNLRISSRSQNNANRTLAAGRSGYRGVTWDHKARKWKAYVGSRKNFRRIGVFADAIEAARAYDKAAVERYGQFAKTNFPQEV